MCPDVRKASFVCVIRRLSIYTRLVNYLLYISLELELLTNRRIIGFFNERFQIR
jgi:hypothetical protein